MKTNAVYGILLNAKKLQQRVRKEANYKKKERKKQQSGIERQ